MMKEKIFLSLPTTEKGPQELAPLSMKKKKNFGPHAFLENLSNFYNDKSPPT